MVVRKKKDFPPPPPSLCWLFLLFPLWYPALVFPSSLHGELLILGWGGGVGGGTIVQKKEEEPKEPFLSLLLVPETFFLFSGKRGGGEIWLQRVGVGEERKEGKGDVSS